jgi:hypothetical protein
MPVTDKFTHQIEEFPVGDALIGMTIEIAYEMIRGDSRGHWCQTTPDAYWDTRVIELDEYAADDGVTLEMAQTAWKEMEADFAETIEELILDEACV